MSDLEYLLNPTLNPFEELEHIQILSELVELHDTLKANINKLSVSSIFVPHGSDIPEISISGGIIVFKYSGPKKFKHIVVTPEVQEYLDALDYAFDNPIIPTLSNDSTIIQISTPKS